MNAIELHANSAQLTKIHADWAMFLNIGEQIRDRQINAVNLGREIGLGLQGICQHKQIDLAFFNQLQREKKLPENMNFSAAKRCVHLANALPEPVTSIEEAQRMMQEVFLAGGFMELTERTEPQRSHEQTLPTFVFSVFGAAKDRITKRIEDFSHLDDDSRETVRKQIEDHERWLREIKQKLA